MYFNNSINFFSNHSAQNVDNGIAANDVTQLIQNLRVVFKCIRKAGLKLTIENSHFEETQVEFFGRTIEPDGVAPQDHKVANLLTKIRLPKSKKQVREYIGLYFTAL